MDNLEYHRYWFQSEVEEIENLIQLINRNLFFNPEYINKHRKVIELVLASKSVVRISDSNFKLNFLSFQGECSLLFKSKQNKDKYLIIGRPVLFYSDEKQHKKIKFPRLIDVYEVVFDLFLEIINCHENFDETIYTYNCVVLYAYIDAIQTLLVFRK